MKKRVRIAAIVVAVMLGLGLATSCAGVVLADPVRQPSAADQLSEGVMHFNVYQNPRTGEVVVSGEKLRGGALTVAIERRVGNVRLQPVFTSSYRVDPNFATYRIGNRVTIAHDANARFEMTHRPIINSSAVTTIVVLTFEDGQMIEFAR